MRILASRISQWERMYDQAIYERKRKAYIGEQGRRKTATRLSECSMRILVLDAILGFR